MSCVNLPLNIMEQTVLLPCIHLRAAWSSMTLAELLQILSPVSVYSCLTAIYNNYEYKFHYSVHVESPTRRPISYSPSLCGDVLTCALFMYVYLQTLNIDSIFYYTYECRLPRKRSRRAEADSVCYAIQVR